MKKGVLIILIFVITYSIVYSQVNQGVLEKMKLANSYVKNGLEKFNEDDYEAAIFEFSKAIELYPSDKPHIF